MQGHETFYHSCCAGHCNGQGVRSTKRSLRRSPRALPYVCVKRQIAQIAIIDWQEQTDTHSRTQLCCSSILHSHVLQSLPSDSLGYRAAGIQVH